VAGRIREEDIAELREKAKVDEIVSEYVTLRPAGGGSLKGLCPFHDEKSPSFNVNPQRQFFHCLAGDTNVLTFTGVRPIRELAGGVHRILGSNGRWIDAPFGSYGVQPLLKITLTRNRQRKEIHATDELGRELHAYGTTLNWLKWPINSDILNWWSLVKWEYDGQVVYGNDQDFMNFKHYRRYWRQLVDKDPGLLHCFPDTPDFPPYEG